MTAVSSRQAPQIRAVQWWLVSIAALIALMVVVGGATLPAGLSIVEWKPVTGALPPLDQEQWTQAFEAYKKIPQYREMNAGMNLAEFKTIFWWEFSHRLLGRVIGMAYLLPFLWFMWRGFLGARPEAPAVADLRSRRAAGRGRLVDGRLGAFAAGGSLALPPGRPLILALLIFAAIVWTLRRLAEPQPLPVSLAAEDAPRRTGGADLRAAFSRRTGRRPARRQDLQHLAGIDGALFRRRRDLFFDGRGGAICSTMRSRCSSSIA